MSDIDEISKLIELVALKNRDSFAILYSRTSAKLFGVTLRMLNNRAEAEEALQEVYIKIWQRADQYRRSTYSPMSWLIAIARNHSLDILRARRPNFQPIEDVAELIDDAPNPEQSTVTQDEISQIKNCLKKLPADKAQAVQLAYIQGYSYQELADHYGVPLNTMRTWLRRSLKQLKDCLS